MFDLGAIFVTIKARTEDFEAGLKRVDQGIQKVGKVGDKMKDVGTKMTLFATVPLLGLGGAALKGAADMEQLEVAFTTMLGSAEKAKQLMGEITSFAAKTPFQLTEVQASAKALLAFGIAQENIIPSMKMIGDIASGVGVPLQDLAVIYGKARTQGTLFAEDINQLTERGVPIIAQFAKQFGVAESEVKKLVEQGKVGFKDLEKAFADMSGPGGQFFNLMENQSKTASGQFSNFVDQMTQLAVEIGNKIMPVAMQFLGWVKGLVEWFANLSPQVQTAILIAAGLVAALGPLIFIIGNIITAIRGVSAAITFLAMNPMILAFTAAILLIAGLAYLIITNWDTLKGWFSAFWDFLKGIFEAAFNWIKDNWQLLITILLGPIGFFVAMVITYWEQIKNAAMAVFEFIKNFIMGIWNALVAAVQFYINTYIAIIRGVIGAITGIFNTVKDSIVSIWNSVVGFFGDVVRRIGGAFGGVVDTITAPFKAAFNGISKLWNGSVGKLSFKAPDWVPGLGGKGFSMPTLPMLASGVRNFAGGLAIINERGPELVDLPRGTNVYPANKTSKMLTEIGSGGAMQVVVDMAGANITSPQVADEYAELIGDRIIKRLMRTQRV